MAGICAVLGSDAEQLARRISKCIQHRGPDEESFFVDRDIALGYRELHVDNATDLHQPLANENGTIWITFDGQIYNSVELKSNLEKRHSFKGDSPAEVIVHSYEEEGFNCLSKLNGMFAFCLWDSDKQTLFSARDRVGSKPLYYHRSPDRIIFCSEIKGIFADPSVPKKPNDYFIYEYLMRGYPEQNGDSFFDGIKELMPAHGILLNRDELKVRRYWQPREYKQQPVIRSDESYAFELRQLLHDSIKARLPEGSPVGILLSGGIDSTFIAFIGNDIVKLAPLSTYRKGMLRLFSAVYKEKTGQGDEIQFIREVENALGISVDYVYPSVKGRWEDIRRFVFYIEQPVAVFNYYVFWCLFQASSKKVRLVLSGQGADAILGGQTGHYLTYYRELWKKGKIGVLLKEIVRSLDWILPNLAYKVFYSRTTEFRAKALLQKKFVKKYGQIVKEKAAETLQEALIRDVNFHAPEYLRVDDRISSVFALECRHPYLDNKMLEFAFSIPSSQRIKEGLTKYVMRNAAKGLIPETIWKKRRKLGTPIPQELWMRELYENITQLFSRPESLGREYFSQSAVLNLFNNYSSGKLNRIERAHYTNLLWRILNLELWLETYFDQDNPITN